MSNNKSRHDLSTPEGRTAWKQDAIVYTIGSGTYVKTSDSNGYNPYDTQCPVKPQSAETTAMMKRSLERQYKTKQLVQSLFNGSFR